MRRLAPPSTGEWFLKLIVAAVFLHAGTMKLRVPEGFAEQVAGFRLEPSSLVPWLASMLPWLELLAGFLLVASRRGRTAAFTLCVLSAGFSIAMGQAIARGLEPACGCFGGTTGPLAGPGLWMALGRDLLLMTATAWLYQRSRVEPSRANINSILS